MIVSKYKRFVTQYSVLTLHNQYAEVEGEASDIKSNYILLCINNVLAQLMKYHVLLPHFSAYATAVIMNLTLCW